MNISSGLCRKGDLEKSPRNRTMPKLLLILRTTANPCLHDCQSRVEKAGVGKMGGLRKQAELALDVGEAQEAVGMRSQDVQKFGRGDSGCRNMICGLKNEGKKDGTSGWRLVGSKGGWFAGLGS